MCDTLFVRFSNVATNQATVNPPVPATIRLGLHVVYIMRYAELRNIYIIESK